MAPQYHQFCPIAKAAEVVGAPWTILVIRELLLGTSRFSDFQRGLSQMSPSLLTKRLIQLQDFGLVTRRTVAGRRRCEYALTPAGRELAPIVLGLGEWGMRWARGRMTDDELDVELLMSDFRRRIDANALPTGQTVIQFTFRGLRQFADWWVVVEPDGERELCVEDPARGLDVHLTSDLRTLTEIWAGDLTVRQAQRDGRLTIAGNPHICRRASTWLGRGMFADIRPATPQAEDSFDG